MAERCYAHDNVQMKDDWVNQYIDCELPVDHGGRHQGTARRPEGLPAEQNLRVPVQHRWKAPPSRYRAMFADYQLECGCWVVLACGQCCDAENGCVDLVGHLYEGSWHRAISWSCTVHQAPGTAMADGIYQESYFPPEDVAKVLFPELVYEWDV